MPWVFLAGMVWLTYELVSVGSPEILAARALIGAGLPVFAHMRRRRELANRALTAASAAAD